MRQHPKLQCGALALVKRARLYALWRNRAGDAFANTLDALHHGAVEWQGTLVEQPPTRHHPTLAIADVAVRSRDCHSSNTRITTRKRPQTLMASNSATPVGEVPTNAAEGERLRRRQKSAECATVTGLTLSVIIGFAASTMIYNSSQGAPGWSRLKQARPRRVQAAPTSPFAHPAKLECPTPVSGEAVRHW